MEEENEAIIFAMLIGAVILGIGLAMFFNRPYTGYGAVVLAIGLMTLSLIITMRAEEIIHLKIYPTAARSKTQAQENSEPREPYEVQVEQAPEVQEVEEAQQPPLEKEETQQVQEVEETEEPYTPSMYEPLPPREEETTTAQEPQDANFAESEQEQERTPEPEHEPEQSIEAAPPSSE